MSDVGGGAAMAMSGEGSEGAPTKRAGSSEAAKLKREYERDFGKAWLMAGEDGEDEDEPEEARVAMYGDDDAFPGEDEDEEGDTALTLAAAKLAEMQARRELQEEEKEFPDEVETPIDVPASHRFGKYRGLKSESRSDWRADESLPRSYGRLFQLRDFARTAARVERVMAAAEDKLAGVASS